jgi:predicted  nucleic acid-binding Zn-ribbon protein
MNLTEIISLFLNAMLGGGMAIQFLTLRSIKAKARGEADAIEASVAGTELENVEKAIKIWREMAESLKNELKDSREKYTEVACQVDALRKEVARVNTTSNKILRLLDRITHENFDKIVGQIKTEINDGNQ